MSENREIVISRVFDASPAQVWQAWADPQRIVKWWGPRGFTTTTHEWNLSPGGIWRFTMHGPDGRDYPNRIIFKEVVEQQRIVYAHDDGGELEVPIEFDSQIIFESIGDKTKLTLRTVFPTTEARDRVERENGAVQGGIEHVARLAEHLAAEVGGSTAALTITLPDDRRTILTRAFNAPRQRVFEAFTKAEHVRQWWGCATAKWLVCDIDFRVGGSYRFVQEIEGQTHPFKGEYREIVAPERIVQTFIYDVDFIRDHPAIETIRLDEVDGKTVLTNTLEYDSIEARNGHLHSGMESGASESMDRLAGLVESAKKS